MRNIPFSEWMTLISWDYAGDGGLDAQCQYQEHLGTPHALALDPKSGATCLVPARIELDEQSWNIVQFLTAVALARDDIWEDLAAAGISQAVVTDLSYGKVQGLPGWQTLQTIVQLFLAREDYAEDAQEAGFTNAHLYALSLAVAQQIAQVQLSDNPTLAIV